MIFTWLKAYAAMGAAAVLAVLLVIAGMALTKEKSAHSKTTADRDRIALAYSVYVKDQLVLNKAAADRERDKQDAIQTAADKFQGDAYAQINRLKRDNHALVVSLQNRPSRPAERTDGTGVRPPTVAGTEARGCTGAELFRQDAEVAIGIAADADELRIEYNKLWNLYEQARGEGAAPVKP